MRNKAGQLANIQGIIFVMIFVGVLIAAGFLILGEFRDEVDDVAFTTTNESGGWINVSGYTVDEADKPGFHTFAVTEARNGSVVIAAANYTVDATTGIVTNATAVAWPDVEFDYTFLAGDESYEGINETMESLDTVPNLLGLVILIAMVIVIIALVFTIPGIRTGA